MKHIAVVNRKGGVGKTTITANLGHALALRGHHVVVVDMDPLGQLSACLGVFRPPSQGVDEVLLNSADFLSAAISTREEMQLIPAGNRLGEVEKLNGGIDRSLLLRNAVDIDFGQVDYVLYDSPPTSGLLMVNAILAADEVVVPVTGDYLGLHGAAQLMRTIQQFDRMKVKPLKQWIVLSRYNARRRITKEVTGKLAAHFKGQILATPINERTILAECPGAGRTIFEYKPSSKSAEDFSTLAEDLILQRTL